MTFAGLSKTDRAVLRAWLANEQPSGIDTLIDFAERPWPTVPDVVIGVFEAEHALASWILIRDQLQWVVVGPRDDTISDVYNDLAGALDYIRRAANG
jgi:hypothetical protein